jgi:ribosomal protein S18 acetylase RimI-like enzyme
MYLVQDIETLNNIIKEYFLRNTITNNYVLINSYSEHIAERNLYTITKGENVCVLVKKANYYQMYYYINNLQNSAIFDCDGPVVMEILYRGEAQRPAEIFSYWVQCGFRQHLTRDLMTASYSQIKLEMRVETNIRIKYAEKEDEVTFTKMIMDSTFDKYTGDILTLEEVKSFAENHNILCAYFKDKLSGILQFEIKNNIVWLGHIAVAPEFRGMGIANSLVNAYIKYNALQPDKRYHLWVIRNNNAAVNMYRKFGFIYGNKSSASMLKE